MLYAILLTLDTHGFDLRTLSERSVLRFLDRPYNSYSLEAAFLLKDHPSKEVQARLSKLEEVKNTRKPYVLQRFENGVNLALVVDDLVMSVVGGN